MDRIEAKTLVFLASVALTFGFASHAMVSRSVRTVNPSGMIPLAAIRVNGRNEKPGSELFPGKGPYIPSGLSQEEYFKIKKDEADRTKRMDFGAWGPRFKRTETPDGDWMVMPSLWTNGFIARSRVDNTYKNNKVHHLPGESLDPVAMATSIMRSNLPGLLMSYILLDTLATAFKMVQSAADLTVTRIIFLILRVPTINSSAFNVSLLLKTHVTKWMATGILTPLMSRALETLNRRRLWSHRRTIVTCAGLSISSLSLLALLLRSVALS